MCLYIIGKYWGSFLSHCMDLYPILCVSRTCWGTSKLQELFYQNGVIQVLAKLMYGRACNGRCESQHCWHALFQLGWQSQTVLAMNDKPRIHAFGMASLHCTCLWHGLWACQGLHPLDPWGYIPVDNMLFIPVLNILFIPVPSTFFIPSQYVVYPSLQYVVYPSP